MSVFETMASIATCLCNVLVTQGRETCFCGVVPGEVVSQDFAGNCEVACGMAWVRLGNAYPSTTPGQADQTVSNCSKPLGIDIEVGITRCIEVDEDGNSPEELLEATDMQIQDMLAMREAILCCPDLSAKDYILGSYRPVGPEGGLYGGVWTVYITK